MHTGFSDMEVTGEMGGSNGTQEREGRELSLSLAGMGSPNGEGVEWQAAILGVKDTEVEGEDS